LKMFRGAILVVTHDRVFMKCVVEGEAARGEDADDSGDEDEEGEYAYGEGSGSGEGWKAQKGTVYRMTKGSLKVMERGMAQYEEIAERSSRRLIEGG